MGIRKTLNYYKQPQLAEAFAYCMEKEDCSYQAVVVYLIKRYGEEIAKKFLKPYEYSVFCRRARDLELEVASGE